MKRSKHRIGLLVGVLTLVAVVVACVSVVPAGAVDVKPRRVIRDRDPNFSTLSVDSVNNEILVGNDAQESLQVYSRTAHGLLAPLREIKSPPATDTTSPHNTLDSRTDCGIPPTSPARKRSTVCGAREMATECMLRS